MEFTYKNEKTNMVRTDEVKNIQKKSRKGFEESIYIRIIPEINTYSRNKHR